MLNSYNVYIMKVLHLIAHNLYTKLKHTTKSSCNKLLYADSVQIEHDRRRLMVG